MESESYSEVKPPLNTSSPQYFESGDRGDDGEPPMGEMDPLYCLICCGAVVKATGSVIKQEVVDLDGNIHLNSEVEQLDLGESLPLLVVEEEEEKRNVFQCFCNLFNVKSPRKGMWSSGRGVHDGDGDNNQVPFCGGCSSQLIMLFKLKKKVDELEKVIKSNLEAAEEKFEEKLMYQTDKRYGKIRKRILGGKKDVQQSKTVKTEVKNPPKKKRGRPKKADLAVDLDDEFETSFSTQTAATSSHTSSNISRRSSHRSSKPVSRLGVGGAEGGDPVVVVSKEDKYRAERYQDSFVKVEPTPLNVLEDEDDDDDGLEDFSTFDPLYIPPSPAHSFTLEEDDDEEGSAAEVEEDELSAGSDSDAWIPPSRTNSPKKTPTTRSQRGRKRRTSPEASEEPETELGEIPLKIKRKVGRPRTKFPDPPLPGPALKFKKSIMTKVDRKTGTITFLKVPLTRLPGGLSYQCTLCSEIFPNVKRLMSAHVIREHTDRYVCKLCGKRLCSSTMLKTHLRAHTGAGPKPVTACPICEKPYARQYLLDIHRWSHYSEEEKNEAISRGDKLPPEYDKKHQCDQCPKRFATNHLLQKHHVTNHQAEEERPKELCPMCGVAVHHLRGHIARVHEEVPEDQKLPCTQCPKTFKTYILLNRHKRMVHCGVRDFKCTMCPREFATKKQMNEHIQVHMNIRRFQCEFCASAFVKKHHLQRHNKIYHDDGSQPRRPAFIRGPEKKTMEQRNCFKNQGQSSTNQEDFKEEEFQYE